MDESITGGLHARTRTEGGSVRRATFGCIVRAALVGLGWAGGILGVGSGWGCSKSAGAEAAPHAASAPAVLASAPAKRAAPASSHERLEPGDPTRGLALIKTHQCNRCHEGTSEPVASFESHCVNCHRQILDGTFPGPKEKLARWRPNVEPMRAVPSLVAVAGRLSRDWIARYLLEPYDLRPMLEPTMPRLGLSAADARDIAAYLTSTSLDAAPAPTPGDGASPAADVARGRRLLDERGCGACHRMSGVEPLALSPDRERARHQDAVLLAPDLRYVRDRWSAPALVRWLVDPRAMKPDTSMPPTGLDEEQARDVAAYLLTAPLAAPAHPSPPKLLPRLERRVSYAEVDEKVFRRTCRHCHGDPSVANGDGGPGNTGGFGFAARGIDFSSYRALASGYLDARGERRSLFETTEHGVPRLVAVLIARHEEERGNAHPGVRGMPLGLPALSLEQIQLVDTWISQGRPR